MKQLFNSSDRNQGIYFSGFYELRTSFWVTISLSFFLCIVCWILSLGIVWYEKFGNDHKRTLMNKLVSSIFCTAIIELPILQLIEAFRFLHGPLSETFCYFLTTMKNSFKWQILLLLDLCIGSRYMFGFWLKNPGAVKVRLFYF